MTDYVLFAFSQGGSSIQGEAALAEILPGLVETCTVPPNGKNYLPVLTTLEYTAFAKPQPMSV